MPSRGRAVLICGPARPLALAVARGVADAGVAVGVQAAHAEATAAARVCAAIRKRGGSARVIEAALGGDRPSRDLIAAAARALRRLDAIVICAAGHDSRRPPDVPLEQWSVGLSEQLRAPFFVAKHAAAQLRRGPRGGRLVLVWSAPPHDDTSLGRVVHEGLLCLVDALPRAVGRGVAVAAVIGRPARRAAELAETARAVHFVLVSDPSAANAVLRLT
jgi:NAD(P)-dependent dehydrogenase (short-subunit alcohol dehydrogenase family)